MDLICVSKNSESEKLDAFKKVPQNLCSCSDVSNLMSVINSLKVCNGSSDSKFTTLVEQWKEKFFNTRGDCDCLFGFIYILFR